jgi:8-oxo-dGTP pyrophosphatase MutT (NUDIX family)
MKLIKKNKYRKGVFMVTYSIVKGKPKYLILKRKLHWKGYGFPKGGIENSESKFETIQREISEETGLEIKNIKNHHKSSKWLYTEELKDRPGVVGQTWSLFSVEVKKGPIKVDKKEHYSGSWLDYDKAVDKLTYENQKVCLDIVNNFLRKKFRLN